MPVSTFGRCRNYSVTDTSRRPKYMLSGDERRKRAAHMTCPSDPIAEYPSIPALALCLREIQVRLHGSSAPHLARGIVSHLSRTVPHRTLMLFALLLALHLYLTFGSLITTRYLACGFLRCRSGRALLYITDSILPLTGLFGCSPFPAYVLLVSASLHCIHIAGRMHPSCYAASRRNSIVGPALL